MGGQTEVMTFRNNKVVVLWGFAAVFMFFVAAMSYVLIRDGVPPESSPVLIVGTLAIFWLAGLGLSAFAASKYCLRVTVHADGTVAVAQRFPFRTVVQSVARADIRPAEVFESRDDEGSPYFHARLTLADGTNFDLVDGYAREICESTATRFNAVLWPPSLREAPYDTPSQ